MIVIYKDQLVKTNIVDLLMFKYYLDSLKTRRAKISRGKQSINYYLHVMIFDSILAPCR